MNFPALKNDRLLRAAKGLDVDKIPVWIMRQAGRYLPEFRAMREKYDFFKICQTPELASEVTLQPINRFPDLDAAIIFSDILVIPQALGIPVEMRPGVGPVLLEPINVPDDIKKLKYPLDVKKELDYVFGAITLTRMKLDGRVPLIGFSGGPWTLMCYMIEGGGSKTYSKPKKWLFQHRDDSHKLLKLLTDVITNYLFQQISAGAQLLQVFESNAEYLGPDEFKEFLLPYLIEINGKVKELCGQNKIDNVPMTIFAKGAHYALEDLGQTGYDVIGLDWTIDPELARKLVPNVTFQGNLDPCALYSDETSLRLKTLSMLKKFGKLKYIANLGHGIYPDVDFEKVKIFTETVHEI